MEPSTIGILCIALLVFLILANMPVAIAMISTSFVGVFMIKKNVLIAGKLLYFSSYQSLSIYDLAVLPLFLLMGIVVGAGGLAEDAFSAAKYIFRRIPAGVGIAVVAANAVFAAITGVSMVSAAVFGKVAVPEMLRIGYGPRFSVGVVAGSSVLGMLIPPSILLVLYAMLAELSIGKMFIAGLVPGVFLAFWFGIGILCLSFFKPGFVYQSSREFEKGGGAGEGPKSLLKLLPMLVLAALMLGGLYGGIFTPAEASAIGVLGSLLLTLAQRRLSFRQFSNALYDTGRLTAGLGLLVIGANMFSSMLTLSNLPAMMVDFITEYRLGLIGVVTAVIILELFLGCLMDALSNMLIAVPIIIPLIRALGGDLVWFGIVAVVAAEVGLLTPPFGMSAFVIKSTVADDRISIFDIFAGCMPFVLIMLLVIILLVVFPGLVVYPK